MLHTNIVRVGSGLVFGWLTLLVGVAADPLVMSYTSMPTGWPQGLLIGNGRLGANICGTTSATEHLQFNEDTLWIGEPHDYSNTGGPAQLSAIRSGVFAATAGTLTDTGTVANNIRSHFRSVPYRHPPYNTFGDLYISGHATATRYTRKLDLETAVATVEYDADGNHYKREYFVTHPGRAIVVRYSCDTPGGLTTTIRLTSDGQPSNASFQSPEVVSVVGSDRIKMTGRLTSRRTKSTSVQDIANPLYFEAQVKVINDGGSISPSGSNLVVAGATTVTLELVANTNFVDFQTIGASTLANTRCEADMTALNGISYSTLKSAHIADYQSYFKRCSIELGDSSPAVRNQSISARLANIWTNTDPDLAELYFQYGRYLLICSSRPGTQPANLQGLWCSQAEPAWECQYTTNINTEMNYWPAEVTNLADCAEPLFNMIQDLTVTGHTVAINHYGISTGWVTNHNVDIWRGAAPVNNAYDCSFPCGGLWLCQHLWWHYEYTGDTAFLQNVAYPAMKGAVQFMLSYLITDPRSGKGGYLVTCPTNSPEWGPNNGYALVPSSAMDNQIIREVFAATVAAAQTLGVDSAFQTQISTALSNICPDKVGTHGQLMEWPNEGIQDNTDNHRHISHLWALMPGEGINWKTPAMFAAARVSMLDRGGLTASDANGNTGWAQAHRFCAWARLREGDNAYATFQGLLNKKTTLSLMNRGGATPVDDLQIDGNMAGTVGIAEMLLQSHANEISFLPALPSASSLAGWRTGSVRGFRARGGVTTSFAWANGEVTTATLSASLNRTLQLRVPPSQTQIVAVTTADTYQPATLIDNGDGTISVPVQADENYTIWFSTPPLPVPVTLRSFTVR